MVVISDDDISRIRNSARWYRREDKNGYDFDDLAGDYLLDRLEKRDLEQIQNPTNMNNKLQQINIDRHRWETAEKRGGKELHMSLEALGDARNSGDEPSIPLDAPENERLGYYNKTPEECYLEKEKEMEDRKTARELLNLLDTLYERADLSPEEKECLELVREGWKAAEIAEHQGASRNAHYTRLTRARGKMRQARDEWLAERNR